MVRVRVHHILLLVATCTGVLSVALSRTPAVVTAPAADFGVAAAGERISRKQDGLHINYTSNIEGMCQDFIVEQRPASDEVLRVHPCSGGDLRSMIVREDHAVFVRGQGEYQKQVAYYHGLKVWDAAARELAAHMGTSGNLLALVADDEGAEYPVTIDRLLSDANWFKDSTFFMAGAGDVNGDGYDDVLIVEWYGIRLYHGSATGLGTSPAWTAPAGMSLRSDVAGIGDINGDGYDDIMIPGAYQNGGTIEYRVFLFQGSANGLSEVPNWSVKSDDGYHPTFGESIAGAGDVNSDGYDDVIIAEPSYSGGGIVLAYYGSPLGLSIVPDWIASAGPRDVHFGSSIASAGDVNGDNYDDVIIGSRGYSGEIWEREGAVYIYYGSLTGLKNQYAWTAKGNYFRANLGASVSGLGDINNDGYDDVVAGLPSDLLHPVDAGRAYIFLGSANGMAVTPAWNENLDSLPGGTRCADVCRYGEPVAGVGDINGDGYVDMIVGASGYVVFDIRAGFGTVLVYYGTATGISRTPTFIPGDSISNHFGYHAAAAGDVNGDGLNDIMATGLDSRFFLFHGAPLAPVRNLSGAVIGNFESPVVGANVMLDGNGSLVVTTDTNGRFVFAGHMAPGHHTLTVSASGFHTATFDLTMPDENKHVVLGLIPSNVPPPSPPFTVCATVTSTNGDGPVLSGVTVEIIQLESVVHETVTDAQGKVCSGALPAGSYQVRFSKLGYQTLTADLALNANKQIVVSLTPSNLE